MPANTSLFQQPCLYGMVLCMELRHLRYFVGVVDTLSFTKAAQRLRVAQPALSRQIGQLEEELGVKLLERTPRGVQLTKAGRAFYVEACALLEQSAQAVRVAQQSATSEGAPLNLAYIWGLFHSTVPPLLRRFRRRCPQTPVHLFDLNPLLQAKALADGSLDAGFIGFAEEAANLYKRKVGTCSFVAALPKSHRAARHPKVSLESLAEEFFLGISEETYPGASGHVMRGCERAGFRPRILQMVERGFTILGLVAGNCGVALLPESVKALPHPGVVFRPLTEPITADLYVAWRSKVPSGTLAEFLKIIDDQ